MNLSMIISTLLHLLLPVISSPPKSPLLLPLLLFDPILFLPCVSHIFYTIILLNILHMWIHDLIFFIQIVKTAIIYHMCKTMILSFPSHVWNWKKCLLYTMCDTTIHYPLSHVLYHVSVYVVWLLHASTGENILFVQPHVRVLLSSAGPYSQVPRDLWCKLGLLGEGWQSFLCNAQRPALLVKQSLGHLFRMVVVFLQVLRNVLVKSIKEYTSTSSLFLTANADRRPWDSHWLNKGGGTRRDKGPLASSPGQGR